MQQIRCILRILSPIHIDVYELESCIKLPLLLGVRLKFNDTEFSQLKKDNPDNVVLQVVNSRYHPNLTHSKDLSRIEMNLKGSYEYRRAG